MPFCASCPDSRRLSAALDLLRQIVRLPAQLVLLAHQLLELALQLVGRQLRAREIALLAAQLFLPSRQIADPIERARAFLVVWLLFDLRPGLVVGLLLALQLAIEQVGQILTLTAVPAARPPLLCCEHLSASDLRFRLEQRVQRRHLVRDRVRRVLSSQLLDGASHRRNRVGHGIGRRLGLRRDLLRRPGTVRRRGR